jgi:PPOX class probable F420-dependent enzyme
MSDQVMQFERKTFLNLETFKRSGLGVKTPVWFAQAGSALYVRTGSESGKVKRVRNNGRARVVPSDAQGNPLGEWVDAAARLVDAEEAERANQMVRRKYGAMKIGFDMVNRLQGRNWATIRVDLPEEAGR